MKKVIASLVLASVFLYSASSQAMQPRPPKVEPQEIVDQLNLDQSTADALLQLMQSHREQMEAAHRESSDKSYEQHKAMRARHEQQRADIRNLLGEERFEAFEKLMWQQRQQHRPAHR
jgi:Skp family chaperone for outer membrane proteins